MLKHEKILLLWLFITTISFFSCGDVNEPDHNVGTLPEQNIEVFYLNFVKISVNSTFDNKFNQLSYYETTEYAIGDTIGLQCGIYDGIGTYWENLPESIAVKITSSKGAVEFTQLISNTYLTFYPAVYPPFPHNYFTHMNRFVLNSQYGDTLTAEIRGKNQTLRATLTVKK